MFTPSAALKLDVQLLPPLTEYSTTPPASAGVTVSAPLLVILSLFEVPVSEVSATVGAPGTTLSRVKLKLAALPALPAASTWRT